MFNTRAVFSMLPASPHTLRVHVRAPGGCGAANKPCLTAIDSELNGTATGDKSDLEDNFLKNFSSSNGNFIFALVAQVFMLVQVRPQTLPCAMPVHEWRPSSFSLFLQHVLKKAFLVRFGVRGRNTAPRKRIYTAQ